MKQTNRDEIIASHGVPPRLVGVMSAEWINQLHMFEETVLFDKRQLIEEFFKI